MIIRNEFSSEEIEETEEKPILMIKDSLDQDDERELIHIDSVIFKTFNYHKGDIVELINPKTQSSTAGLVYPSSSMDKGSQCIRISKSLQRNLNAQPMDMVEIRRIEDNEAEMIILAGIDAVSLLRNPDKLLQKLKNKIITKEDILTVYNYGSKYNLLVVDTIPRSNAVRITENTTIQIRRISYQENFLIENIPLGVKNLILGDMKLFYAPTQALHHYKKALKHSKENDNSEILKRIALSYIQKGIQEKNIQSLIRANYYLEKAKNKKISEAYSISNNLQELNDLMVKTEFSDKDLKRFEFPNMMFKETYI